MFFPLLRLFGYNGARGRSSTMTRTRWVQSLTLSYFSFWIPILMSRTLFTTLFTPIHKFPFWFMISLISWLFNRWILLTMLGSSRTAKFNWCFPLVPTVYSFPMWHLVTIGRWILWITYFVIFPSLPSRLLTVNLLLLW